MYVYICYEDVILNVSILRTNLFRPAQASSLDSSGDILPQHRPNQDHLLSLLSSTVTYT